jgi:hypothetical protein
MSPEEKKSLEEKIRQQLAARVSGSTRDVRESAEGLLRQVDELAARLERQAAEGAAQVAADAAAAIEAVEARAAELARTADRTAGLARAVCTVLEQTDQVSALEAMLEGALQFTDGAAIFVLKDEKLGGWRAGGRIERSQVKGVSFPLSAGNSLARALREREPLCSTGELAESDAALFDGFGPGQPAGFLVVPLVIRDRALAILFGAWYDDQGDPAEETALEAFRALAAAALSATGKTPARTRDAAAAKPAAAPAPRRRVEHPPAHTEPAPTPVPTPARQAEPPAPPRQPKPPAPAAAPAKTPAAEDKPRSPWFTPTTKTSSLGNRGTAEARRGLGLLKPDQEEPGDAPLSPEEQELHDDARRFARLLVSEIKLYNEEKVTAGRQEKDLYQRLRTDIERSRQMYNERVPPAIAARTNYFMDELVSILAEGNRETLGM